LGHVFSLSCREVAVHCEEKIHLRPGAHAIKNASSGIKKAFPLAEKGPNARGDHFFHPVVLFQSRRIKLKGFIAFAHYNIPRFMSR
jgi:hypothetical protein